MRIPMIKGAIIILLYTMVNSSMVNAIHMQKKEGRVFKRKKKTDLTFKNTRTFAVLISLRKFWY